MKKLAKRVLWTLTALCMLFASATAVYGETVTNQTGQTEQKEVGVRGKYLQNGEQQKVISVDISWDAMEFTYVVNPDQGWNPENHSYSNPIADDWQENGAKKIYVANHSNIPVNVEFKYNQKTGFEGITSRFSLLESGESQATVKESCTLQEGKLDGNDVVTDTVDASITLVGPMPQGYTDFSDIGTITITIADASAQ